MECQNGFFGFTHGRRSEDRRGHFQCTGRNDTRICISDGSAQNFFVTVKALTLANEGKSDGYHHYEDLERELMNG